MTRSQQMGRWACVLLLTVLTIPLAAIAQSTRGELAGVVKDTSGAVIAGAQIVATQTETGTTRQAVSTSAGAFRIPELAIGRYNVNVSAPGFATSSNKGVLITINSVTPLNVVLKPGAASETVTVDASAPAIQTESSEISGTISQRQIEDLPLSLATGVGGLRSPETFAFLVPGTTGPGSGGPTGLNSNGVFFAKLAGGQSYGAEVMLDGASITRSENGSSFDETAPSIEALQEFKVTTSIPSAEYGRTTAGFESFATKAGTNQYHGTAFTIVKNAAFDANNWFNNGYASLYCKPGTYCSYQRPQDSKFDYGGTLGGPVRLPKLFNGTDNTFFFFAWEQYKLHQGSTVQSTIPTPDEVNGDFSAILGGPTTVINPCTGEPVLQNQIFDPATTNATVSATNPSGIPCRYPFPGNKISTGKSGAAASLLKGFPAPNQPATPTLFGFQNNYSQSYVRPWENTTYTVRIDHTFSDKSKIFGSYSSRDNFSVHDPVNLPIPFNNAGYPQDFQTHYIRVGWDYAFTPNMLNHMNVGYNRTNSKNFAYQIGNANNIAAAGAPNFYSNSFPLVHWDGLDSFTSWGVGNNGDNIDNGLRFNDIVSWQKGRNSFKFGFDWRHQQYSVIQVNIPTINFLRSETDVAALANVPQFQSGNSFASFLLGAVDNGGQTVYNNNPRWNSVYMGGFIQDDIKLTPRLTVNLGLRYDLDIPRKEAHNDTSAFSYTLPDPAAGNIPGALEFAKTCHGCNPAWAETWKKDIGPRVGFAYVLPGSNDKAVIRGGAGIIYGPLQYSDFGSSMTLGYTQGRSTGSFYSGPGTAAAFTPAFMLDSGEPQWTKSFFAPSTDPGQLTGVPGQFIPVGGEIIKPQFGRPSMTTSWGLQVQDEVAQDLIFTLGYMGQASQNLHSGFLTNDNNIDPKYFSLGDHLSDIGSAITTQGGSSMGVTAPYSTFMGNLGQALRPFPQYDYLAGDCCLENVGHSSYEAMVASLNRRFRQGFNLQVSYTWSKNETDADSTIPFAYVGYRSQTQNSNNLRLEKAVSVQNIPQQLSISYLYELPFGKGQRFLNQNRLLDAVVGGWEIGAIQRYQSGQPVDFGCASGAAYFQNCFRFTLGAGAFGNNFASSDYRKNKNKPSFFNQQTWFKPAYRPAGQGGSTDPGVSLADAAFVDMNREGVTSTGQTWLRKPSPDCADGCSYDPFVFGTGIPRVTEAITGPMWLSEDFSLLKNFSITERVKFQFKVEAIDAFNRHRMGMPDMEPADSPSYAADGTPQVSTGFGIPMYVDYGPRNLQLTGRINF
ncbi:MAG: TonB-dependent receptor [Acidobacteriota bacterium]|nr:TonB-dependent receptor [Acidobacteriota bacterium]